MKILELKLTGFLRMGLTNIQEFHWKANKRIQLILGTNGSGKSSFLKELTPMPANPKDYSANGSKIIHIEHNNSKYILTSQLNPTKHYFEKDGTELNPSGTQSVQKELILAEFGLSQEIHDLMTDQEQFTTMSPSRRREWFTMLSEVDYDYAMQFYKKLQTLTRDKQGALKHIKQRIASSSTMIRNPDELQELKSRLTELTAELEFYIRHTNTSIYEDSLDNHNIHNRIEYLSNQTYSYGRQYHDLVFSLGGLEAIELRLNSAKRIQTTEGALLQLQQDTKDLSTELMQLDEEISNSSFGMSNEDLVATQDSLSERLSLLRQQRLIPVQYPMVKIDPGNIQRDTIAISQRLVNLPRHEDKYTKSNYVERKNVLEQIKQLRTQVQTQLAVDQQILQHENTARNDGSRKCPNCGHEHSGNMSNGDYHTLTSKIQDAQERIEDLDGKISSLHVEISDIEVYFDIYRDYVGFTSRYPQLSHLWDYLNNHDYFKTNPTILVNLISQIYDDLDVHNRIVDLDTELKAINAMLSQEGSEEALKYRMMQETYKTKLDIYNRNTDNISRLQLKLKKLVEVHDLALKVRRLESGYTESLKELRSTVESMLKESYSYHANDIVNNLRIEIGNISKMISESESTQTLMNDLRQQSEQLEQDTDILTKLVAALSPTTGIIAKGICGFLDQYLDRMNSIINGIWSYPMMVYYEPSEQLSYKFPVRIQNGDVNPPDVNNGSDSIKQVVDLAFKLTAMHYLHMDDYPIFLDEFGSGFDHRHQIAGMEAVKSLMDNNISSQMFIISHYETSYGSLTNADVIVIDGKNIVIPTETYNEYVTITYRN